MGRVPKYRSTKYRVSTGRLGVLLWRWLLATGSAPAQQAAAKHKPAAPPELRANVVTLASPSPLYEVQIMVRAGSAEDPRGKEGTASLVGRMMLEGGFGDPKNPVTKEKLAEITRPWGEAAYPAGACRQGNHRLQHDRAAGCISPVRGGGAEADAHATARSWRPNWSASARKRWWGSGRTCASSSRSSSGCWRWMTGCCRARRSHILRKAPSKDCRQ